MLPRCYKTALSRRVSRRILETLSEAVHQDRSSEWHEAKAEQRTEAKDRRASRKRGSRFLGRARVAFEAWKSHEIDKRRPRVLRTVYEFFLKMRTPWEKYKKLICPQS